MPRKSDSTTFTLIFSKGDKYVMDWIRSYSIIEERSISQCVVRIIKRFKEQQEQQILDNMNKSVKKHS